MVVRAETLARPSAGDDVAQLRAWLNHLTQDRPTEEQDSIRDACLLARELCQDRQRLSGESAFTHLCTVVEILADMGMDADSLIAAMLYELVQETGFSLAQIRQRFGTAVAHLVEGVSKMDFINALRDPGQQTEEDKQSQNEKLRRMILAMVEDVRVMLIKLAERLHDMRVLKQLDKPQQQRIAHETLDIFSPLANRLGIWQIKWELEDLALRALEPEQYQRIARLLDSRRVDREACVNLMMERVAGILSQARIRHELSGRPKHIYSIWKKMQRKQGDFDKLFDVLAIRILVTTVEECYHVLGLIHTRFPPVPATFDDYIGKPKNNDYRSLHTAVIGPNDKIFEVQIRTHEMHHHAEFGVASHWRYKEGGEQDRALEQKIAWLRQVMEWKEETGSALDFVDRFKSELFEERIYALTPKGQVVELPQGATPIDFAYYIHTELGHRCRGAKVNERIVPLNYTLKTGDQVEILRAKKDRPSRHWLNQQMGYIKTQRARNRVQTWLKQQDSAHHIEDGRLILERELHRLNVSDLDRGQLAHHFNFNTLDDFYAALGRGDLSITQVISATDESVLSQPQPSIALREGAIRIEANDGLLTHMAHCCKPVPNDPVIGYITRDQGIAVHHRQCHHVLRWLEENSECLVRVEWGEPVGVVYPVDIIVQAYDRFGLLRDVSTILTNERINIIGVETSTDEENVARMLLTVEVKNLRQLSRALAKLDSLPNITEVRRNLPGWRAKQT